MSYAILPKQRSPRVAEDVRVDVFRQLTRLLCSWREDPDRLAIACAAWTLAGYGWTWMVDEVSNSDLQLGVSSIDRDLARELVETALYRRKRSSLHRRAEGLLMALEFNAAWAEAKILHDTQLDSCVIECRQLSIDERIAALHDKHEI